MITADFGRQWTIEYYRGIFGKRGGGWKKNTKLPTQPSIDIAMYTISRGITERLQFLHMTYIIYIYRYSERCFFGVHCCCLFYFSSQKDCLYYWRQLYLYGEKNGEGGGNGKKKPFPQNIFSLGLSTDAGSSPPLFYDIILHAVLIRT